MQNSLRSQLNELAQSFADGVLAAIRSASLDDLLAESRGGRRARGGGGGGQPDPLRKGGRLARRTQAEIEAMLAKVLARVRATRGKGLRAEEIRKALSLDARELPRVLKEGLRTRKLKAKGQRRATVYRTL
ncbi:MAG TPA: hypothetical protein VMI75_20595 [Polyangiaceae bacterium]|nr:hypothetical protein [Polyangiaceae bacterium]